MLGRACCAAKLFTKMANQDFCEHRLPRTGLVLAFIIDCLGIPKEGLGYSHKDLQRLRKGGLAQDTYWKVARSVMDAIAAAFIGNTAAWKTDSVLKQKIAAPVKRICWRKYKNLLVPVPEFGAPPEAIYWKRNAAGELEDFGEVLMHDWLEFLFRHEFLVEECGDTETPSEKAVISWLFFFVVPFLAQNLIEYLRNDALFERGMPRGQFWYLPQTIPQEGGKSEQSSFKWPVNSVLEWWQDLLGYKLESVADKLCSPGKRETIEERFREYGGLDDEARQVREWMKSNRPPKPATIEHWCAQGWNYKGTFLDTSSAPLRERWNNCRAFLARKGFANEAGNWIKEMDERPKELFEKQYRGEMLEKEILPFRETPFAAFFDLPDPIAAGLPVSEFIERVAERWSEPTSQQLKARLLIAAASQRAFATASESLGFPRTCRIINWFSEVYCFLIDLGNRGVVPSQMIRILRGTPPQYLHLRYSCEWLFDEESWDLLPSDIGKHLRSE